MAKEWYVRHDDRVLGPFPAAKLKQLFRSGRLTASDSLSKGSPDGPWRPARSISALFPDDTDPVNSEYSPPQSRTQPPAIQPTQPSSGSGAKLAVLSILGTLLVLGLGTGAYFLATGDPKDSPETTVTKDDTVKNTSAEAKEPDDDQPTGKPSTGSSKQTNASTEQPLDAVAEVEPEPTDKATSDSAIEQAKSSIGLRPKVRRSGQAAIREETKQLNQDYLDKNAELLKTLGSRDTVNQAENTQFISKLLLETQPKAITPKNLSHRLPTTRMDVIRKSRRLKGQGTSPVKALIDHLYKHTLPNETTGVVLQTLLAFEDFQDVQCMQCIVDLRTFLNKMKTDRFRNLRPALRSSFRKAVETRILPECDIALEKIIVGGGRYASDWKQFNLTSELTLSGTAGQKKRGRTPLIKIAQIGASHYGITAYPDLKRTLERFRNDDELPKLLQAAIIRALKVSSSAASKDIELAKAISRAYKENADSEEIVKAAATEFAHTVTHRAASKGVADCYADIERLYLGNSSNKDLSDPSAAALQRVLNLSAIHEGLEMLPLFHHVGSGKGGSIPLYFKASDAPVIIRTSSQSDEAVRRSARAAEKRLGPLPEFADEWVSNRNRLRVLPSGKTVVLKEDGFKLTILTGKATVFRIIDSDSMLCESTFVERSKKRRLFQVSGFPTANLADEDSISLNICLIGKVKLGSQTLLHCIPSVLAKSPLRYAEFADYKSRNR